MLLILDLLLHLVYRNVWRYLVYWHFLIYLVSYVLKATHSITTKSFLGSDNFILDNHKVCLIIFAWRTCINSILKSIVDINFSLRSCTWSWLTFITTGKILIIILLIINLRFFDYCARLILIQIINFTILLWFRKLQNNTFIDTSCITLLPLEISWCALQRCTNIACQRL